MARTRSVSRFNDYNSQITHEYRRQRYSYGFFDCVVVRFPNDNFARNDISLFLNLENGYGVRSGMVSIIVVVVLS